MLTHAGLAPDALQEALVPADLAATLVFLRHVQHVVHRDLPDQARKIIGQHNPGLCQGHVH